MSKGFDATGTLLAKSEKVGLTDLWLTDLRIQDKNPLANNPLAKREEASLNILRAIVPFVEFGIEKDRHHADLRHAQYFWRLQNIRYGHLSVLI